MASFPFRVHLDDVKNHQSEIVSMIRDAFEIAQDIDEDHPGAWLASTRVQPVNVLPPQFLLEGIDAVLKHKNLLGRSPVFVEYRLYGKVKREASV